MPRLTSRSRSRISMAMLVVMLFHALVGQALGQVFCIRPNGQITLEQGWNGHCLDANSMRAKNTCKHCVDLPANSTDHHAFTMTQAAAPDLGLVVILLPTFVFVEDDHQPVGLSWHAINDPPQKTTSFLRRTTVLLI